METHPPKPLLLDGATATNLFQAGMPHEGCPEQWILRHPGVIQALQSAFVKAGSDVIYAPTFGANRIRLAQYGLEGETADINRRLVKLSREVAQDCLVAGNLSPTGLSIEPYEEINFDLLCDVYTEQANALNEAGADLFAIESMLSLTEARAAVLACRRFQKPVYVTFTLNERGELYSGAEMLSSLVTLQELGISGYGFNCCFGPNQVAEAVREAAAFAKIPLIAKPNAGMPNPLRPDVYEISPVMLQAAMRDCLDAGAEIIGGCCGCTPEHIAALRELLDTYRFCSKDLAAEKSSTQILLTSFKELFRLESDRIELSAAIYCSLDMTEKVIAAEAGNADVLLFSIQTVEEASVFAQNAHLVKLPVCFHSDEEEGLERALFLYNGIAMVDGRSSIPADALRAIAARYGAVVY